MVQKKLSDALANLQVADQSRKKFLRDVIHDQQGPHLETYCLYIVSMFSLLQHIYIHVFQEWCKNNKDLYPNTPVPKKERRALFYWFLFCIGRTIKLFDMFHFFHVLCLPTGITSTDKVAVSHRYGCDTRATTAVTKNDPHSIPGCCQKFIANSDALYLCCLL